MDFSDYLLTDFDEELKQMDNLKWLPWVGQFYNRTRTVILGESQYEDGDEWQEDNIGATRTLIGKGFSNSRGKIYSNAEKVLLSLENPTLTQGNFLWKSVVYWNLVPRLMSTRNERPSDADFDKGWKLFFNIVEVLNPTPTICIVLGKSSCGRLGYFLNNNDTLWDRNVPEFYAIEKIINLSKNGNKLKLIFINHPSGSFGFDYEHWANLISNNEPNLKHLLMQI